MVDEDIYDEVEQEQLDNDPKKFEAACSKLLNRCKAADIECNKGKDIDGDTYIIINLPAGRKKHRFTLYDLQDIKKFSHIPFERYVFLGDYIAYCSYGDSIIEAEIAMLRSGSDIISYDSLKMRLYGGESKKENGVDSVIELNHPSKESLRVSISPISKELTFFGGWSRSASIKILGVEVSQHDKAVELLERVSNSLFFQIDLALNLSLGLKRSRKRIKKAPRAGNPQNLQFPNNEYHDAPMALYWYARGALKMPLLQFLAYYQCIEFYFPIYSKAEAIKKIKRLLKDPIFRPDDDAHIERLLSAIKSNRGNFSYGDERSQLRSTLQECIDPIELRNFLISSKEREEFFLSKNKGLTEHMLPLSNKNADLRNDVADRIYDIRCKIVHTKSGSKEGEIELLLPFSKEADLLYYDIDLVKYLAQQCLIASSKSMKL